MTIAAGGVDGDAVAGAGSDAQLVAGIAAVSALRAKRTDQEGFAEGAQEAWEADENPHL